MFSALLSVWWERGAATVTLRLLPFIFFIGSVLILYRASLALLGALGAAIVLTMFIGHIVTHNFAVQLRGYSASWTFITLMFWSATHYLSTGHRGWAAAFLFSTMASIAILPTNLLASALVLVFSLGWLACSQIPVDRRHYLRIAVIALAPCLGFLSYAAMWRQFLHAASTTQSHWSLFDTGTHWLRASLSGYWFLIPLLLLGIGIVSWRLIRDYRILEDRARIVAALLGAFIVVTVISGVLLPHGIFPRNLTPFLPLWCFLVAGLSSIGWRCLFPTPSKITQCLFGIVMLASLFQTTYRAPCGGEVLRPALPHDLCFQYYRETYSPASLLTWLNAEGTKDPLVVLAGPEGFYTLSFLIHHHTLRPSFQLSDYAQFREQRRTLTRADRLLLLMHGPDEITELKKRTGTDVTQLRLVKSLGYFSLFEVTF